MLKRDWSGSCVHTECSLHQLAPYIGKLKSSIAAALIEEYTKPGDTILEPFVGAGTIALEATLRERRVVACDVNPYAVLLTRAKLFAPPNVDVALDSAAMYLKPAKINARGIDLRRVPRWVRQFFHPQTLREIIALRDLLAANREHFLFACLLGILHHQRPGFLSYPASHLVPYLRSRLLPREEYPDLYTYRDVDSRLRAKIARAFKSAAVLPDHVTRRCRLADARKLRLDRESVDAVITSPPYMNALDYVRDNRLRLWLLGADEVSTGLESPGNQGEFINLMKSTLSLVGRVLRKGGKCVLVVGEANRSAKGVDPITVTRALIGDKRSGLREECAVFDVIPDVRRSRRSCDLTKRECIIVASRTAA